LSIKPKIRAFLTLKEGRYFQKRMQDEFRKAKRIHKRNCKKTSNARKAKTARYQGTAPITDSVTESIARAFDKGQHDKGQGFSNENPIPPDGGNSARMRAREARPKIRTINDVLNEMQGRDAADDEYYTIEASVERRDSGRSADIVQFHALSKSDGS
jgi:hypothetical protein